MIEPSIAAKADYADAIFVARRAKNWLFLLLLLVLVGEIALFFTARMSTALDQLASSATTQPSSVRLLDGLKYLVALAGFIGVTGSITLAIVMLLLVIVMLTGRTLGVAKVTSAFVWSILLIVLLFPWQAILANPTLSAKPDAMEKDFKLPGVIYTWTELSNPVSGAKFHPDRIDETTLRWARFVGFPALAVLILMSIQIKSSRGIKAALGEDVIATSDVINA